MSADVDAILSQFGGTARLFPLPNLVLFPHAVQPLHIFEPRYRQLMEDALAGDRLMAMALLQPGWEEHYHDRPPIHPVVCLGHVGTEQRLPDGRFNLLLHGLSRARVLEEVPTDRLYRTARVKLLPDVAVEPHGLDKTLCREVGEQVMDCYAGRGEALEQVQRLLAGGLPLGILCDVFAFALPLDVDVKRSLLEEPDVARRARILVEKLRDLRGAAGTRRSFPPGFSAN
jgi:Lon protease-like protein